MSYDYENAYDEAKKELRRLRTIIGMKEQEAKELRSELEKVEDLRDSIKSSMYFDKDNAIDLKELGYSRINEDWEFVDSEDYGYDGTEIYKNNKTNKHYMIEWTRIRHYDKAVEIDAETGRVKV